VFGVLPIIYLTNSSLKEVLVTLSSFLFLNNTYPTKIARTVGINQAKPWLPSGIKLKFIPGTWLSNPNTNEV